MAMYLGERLDFSCHGLARNNLETQVLLLSLHWTGVLQTTSLSLQWDSDPCRGLYKVDVKQNPLQRLIIKGLLVH